MIGACSFDWDKFDPRGEVDSTESSGGGTEDGVGGAGNGNGGSDGGNGGASDGGAGGMVAGFETQSAGPGLDAEIPDEGYDGSLASMVCVPLTFQSGSISSLEVTMGIDHPWVGDLVLKIASPIGTVTTLMSRPGLDEPEDSAYEPNGIQAMISSSARVEFRDDSQVSAENMAMGLGPTDVVCQSDGRCDFFTAPGAGPGTALSDFLGEDAAGQWQVCAGDGDDNDKGTVDFVSLLIQR